MTQKSIDLSTLQMLVKLVTPAPIAPVAPVIPSMYDAGSEGAFGMAKDIQYLRETVNEIKTRLEKITDSHVSLVDFTTFQKGNATEHADYETRLRVQGTLLTRIQTWGTALVLLIGVIETLLIHFWH